MRTMLEQFVNGLSTFEVVTLIVVGGFLALLAVELLFDWIRAAEDKWTGDQSYASNRLPPETQRESDRVSRRIPAQVPGHQKSGRPLAGTEARPRGVSRPLAATFGVDHATAKPAAHQGPANGCDCHMYRRGQYRYQVCDLCDPPAGRGPGRGDPPKGVAH